MVWMPPAEMMTCAMARGAMLVVNARKCGLVAM